MRFFILFIYLFVLVQVTFPQIITFELNKKNPKKNGFKASLKHYNLDVVKKLKNIYDNSYMVKLKFGSNKKEFSLNVDTGSADLFIPSIENKKCQKENQLLQKKVSLYDCKQSITCRKSDEIF